MNYEDVIEAAAGQVPLMIVAVGLVMLLIGAMGLDMGQTVGILYWLIGGIMIWAVASR